MQEKKNNNDLIGWEAVFSSYKGKDTFKDSLVSFILSFIIVVIVHKLSLNTYHILSKIVDVSLDILPAIVSFLLAAYAIALTLFWSDYGKRIRKYENGRTLLTSLNSSFAAIIFFMSVGLFLSLLVQISISMELKSLSLLLGNIINLIGIFIIVLILIFSVYSLKDIIINIFNLGQISSIFDDDVN